MKNLFVIAAAVAAFTSATAYADPPPFSGGLDTTTSLHSFSGVQGSFGSMSSTGAAVFGIAGAGGGTHFGYTSNAGATANLGDCGCDVGVHTYGNAAGGGYSFGASGALGFASGQNLSGFSGEFSSFGEGYLNGEFSSGGFNPPGQN